MDQISERLKEMIKLSKSERNSKDTIQYSMAYIQYKLTLTLAILYNADWSSKGILIEKNQLSRPALGTLLSMSRQLNNGLKLISNWKALDKEFTRFITLRNNSGHGHGFDYSHDNTKLLQEIESIISAIDKGNFPISHKFNIIKVNSIDNSSYIGVNYHAKGKITPWSYPISGEFVFSKDDIYIQTINLVQDLFGIKLFENLLTYLKISPFISIDKKGFWLFQSITEPLTGMIKYNNLFHTETKNEEYAGFKMMGLIESEEYGMREVSSNGIIRNNYNNNYKEYISIYEKDKVEEDIIEFLKSKSSALATIWGHGGVGKTAILQQICEKIFLSNRTDLVKSNLYFNYIIFLSAKDRKYNYITGKIEEIKHEKLIDYKDLITKINQLVFNDDSFNVRNIVTNFSGKMLIVIDDFETLTSVERQKIAGFADTLNVNLHKVIISSRLALSIGKEIEKKEFNAEDSIKFLKAVLKIEMNISPDDFDLDDDTITTKIFQITTGRPLFIYHFAYLLIQNQNLEEIINIDIKNIRAAIEFLYGRFYDYLDEDTRLLYKVLGLMAGKNDLLCRTSNLKFISDLDDAQFNKSLYLLSKARIISISESRDFLTIYSPEILQNMSDKIRQDVELNKLIDEKLKHDSFLILGSRLSIFQQKFENIKNKARFERKAADVIEAYESVIDDKTFSIEERILVFEDLMKYLSSKSIDRKIALELCNDYSPHFRDSTRYNIIFFNILRSNGKPTEALFLAQQLLEKASSKPITDFEFFNLAGKYLEITSRALIQRKEDLNRDFTENDREDIKTMNYNLKNDMISLIDEGKIIFLKLVSVPFHELSRSQKNSISNGISFFLKMIRRTLHDKYNKINNERYEVFKQIISYGIKYFPSNFRDLLIHLKYQVENNEIEMNNPDAKQEEQIDPPSDFAEQLKKALQDKTIS